MSIALVMAGERQTHKPGVLHDGYYLVGYEAYDYAVPYVVGPGQQVQAAGNEDDQQGHTLTA